MSNTRETARKERLRKELAEIKLKAQTDIKKLATQKAQLRKETRSDLILPQIAKKNVRFASEQKLEHLRAITPRIKSSDRFERKLQEDLNRLIIHWLKSQGAKFQDNWVKKHPKLPHVTDQDYEERLELAMDIEANKYAQQQIEKRKLLELQQLPFSPLGGGRRLSR